MSVFSVVRICAMKNQLATTPLVFIIARVMLDIQEMVLFVMVIDKYDTTSKSFFNDGINSLNSTSFFLSSKNCKLILKSMSNCSLGK